MKYKISDICLINKRSYSTKDDYEFVNYLDTGNITKNSISQIQYIDLSSTKLPSRAKRIVQQNDIIYSTVRPNQEHYGFIKETPNNFLVSTGFTVLTPDQEKVDPYWLYCYLTQKTVTNQMQLIAEQNVSTYPSIRPENLAEIELDLPDLETQKKIVRILSALDQKIELNNQQNETLFELGRQLYIEQFENNEAVDKVELGNFFPVITGKKDANASSENGKYPFFTCSKTISRIDDYAFDSSAILLAGNGDFNVKFYRGKFDAYQRTYVLIPNNPKYLGFLYWAISYNLPKITANYRGSVIKFITKGNIESFKVPFVDNEFIPAFMKYLEKIEKNNQQNEVLVGLRDALLPKLLSGEIDLNEITINE